MIRKWKNIKGTAVTLSLTILSKQDRSYLVIQDSSCRNHTKIEYKDGLPADGDTCSYHNKPYRLTWCMTFTWRDLYMTRCLARLITVNKNAMDLPSGGSSSLARRRELERTGIKICQDHSHLVKSWVIKPLVVNSSLLYINKSLRDRQTLAILLEWTPKFRWVSKQSLERAHCVVSVRSGRDGRCEGLQRLQDHWPLPCHLSGRAKPYHPSIYKDDIEFSNH